MMRGCWKEWADQYDVDVGGIPTNVDALLEKFKTDEKLNESKLQLTPILRKPVAVCGSNH